MLPIHIDDKEYKYRSGPGRVKEWLLHWIRWVEMAGENEISIGWPETGNIREVPEAGALKRGEFKLPCCWSGSKG